MSSTSNINLKEIIWLLTPKTKYDIQMNSNIKAEWMRI